MTVQIRKSTPVSSWTLCKKMYCYNYRMYSPPLSSPSPHPDSPRHLPTPHRVFVQWPPVHPHHHHSALNLDAVISFIIVCWSPPQTRQLPVSARPFPLVVVISCCLFIYTLTFTWQRGEGEAAGPLASLRTSTTDSYVAASSYVSTNHLFNLSKDQLHLPSPPSLVRTHHHLCWFLSTYGGRSLCYVCWIYFHRTVYSDKFVCTKMKTIFLFCDWSGIQSF